jgi:hypothetical protein
MRADPPRDGEGRGDPGRGDAAGSANAGRTDPEAAAAAALSRLEADGAAILVGGVPTPGVVATAARRLLGPPDDDRRWVVVVGAGTDPGRRLPDGVASDDERVRILRWPGATGSADPGSRRDGPVGGRAGLRVDAGVGVLGRAVADAVRDLADGDDPGHGPERGIGLRVWVDPLEALLAANDREAVVGFVRTLADLVHGRRGRVHFRLPARRADPRFGLLAGACDATVRLRLRERAEACWHFEDDVSSGWRPLEWDPGGGRFDPGARPPGWSGEPGRGWPTGPGEE